MIFSDFYKGPRSPLAKLRQHQPPLQPQASGSSSSSMPDWSSQEYSDLFSRDKYKSRDAIRRYLAAKVRNDWDFSWPRPTDTALMPPEAEAVVIDTDGAAEVVDGMNGDKGYQFDNSDSNLDGIATDDTGEDSDNDAASLYSIMDDDPMYMPLVEWDSDAPPEGPGFAPTNSDEQRRRRAQRRRENRKEMEYNEGLACFEARRIAWTQARTVRLRPRPETPASPTSPQHSPRRFFFRRSMSGPSSTAIPPTVTSALTSENLEENESAKEFISNPSDQSSISSYSVKTIVPIALPIIPPGNILRESIQPARYICLYDKLIINNSTPTCPINLSDMIKTCVTGWKRDGEWPPRGTPAEPSAARKKNPAPSGANNGTAPRRLSLTGFLSRDKDGTGKVRQSLQRAFGIGGQPDGSHGPEKVNI